MKKYTHLKNAKDKLEFIVNHIYQNGGSTRQELIAAYINHIGSISNELGTFKLELDSLLYKLEIDERIFCLNKTLDNPTYRISLESQKKKITRRLTILNVCAVLL